MMAAAAMPARGTLAALLSVGLLAQAMVVSTLFVAGIGLRTLSPGVLGTLALAWPIAAVVVLRPSRATLARWAIRARGALETARDVVLDPPVAIALALVAAMLVWRAFLVTRLPIVDYDGWSYHLVFVDVWLQHDALTLVPQRPWTAGYPAVGELLTAWFAAFTRTDAWAGLTSLLPIPVAIVGTCGLARSLGADRRLSLLAGLLFGMTPALVALAGTTYVDAASVAAVVGTWWLGLRVVRGERDRSSALLLGIASGLAIGTKGTNVSLVAPVVAVAGLVLLRDMTSSIRAPSRAARAPLEALLALGLPLLVIGASWYVKNLLVYGNPLYPFSVGPFHGPTTLTKFAFTPPELEGRSFADQLITSWVTDWRLDRYIYNVRPGGLGMVWPLVAAFAAIGGGLLVAQRRWAPLALLVSPAVLTLLIMPMPWYARLTLFLPALAFPLTAVTLGRMGPRVRLVAGLTLVGLAGISLWAADTRPNVDIRAAVGGGPWPTLRTYARYLLRLPEEQRSAVSLRSQCAGFAAIPPGDRVAPAGFNLLHAVAGPQLDRILTDPIATATDAAGLAAKVEANRASWMVTGTDNPYDRLAASAPDLFIDRGEICQGGRLWHLRGAT